MNQQELKLAMPDGITDAVLYTSDDGKPLPGVLFIPDVWSLRDTMDQMASRVAAEGYTVLLPNPFYRTSPPPVFPFKREDATQEQVMQRIGELAAPLTPQAIAADTGTYVDFLTSQSTTAPVGIGIVGLCMGGMIAFHAAAARPDKISAAASFHGGGLYKADNPASPHLGLHKIKARLYFGHAFEDKSMNADAITELVKALKDWGGHFESEIYEGARHGWTVPDNPSYNQPQAERAYQKLIALFKEELV
ncbi:MAG: dienelactone hydrolase family protein [Edaphobacter sp.]|uniref:dienelactone hydrolase family protein n=1 Tax=Edaphobacter sp. TaxID=1934404 RepID=UPI00239E5392|nr:dienelactone hydrolase family protein [Edaphobacter sp.]MDE1175241.1 dienelactone hydrolase family protein [Edaphobacter sp.]